MRNEILAFCILVGACSKAKEIPVPAVPTPTPVVASTPTPVPTASPEVKKKDHAKDHSKIEPKK